MASRLGFRITTSTPASKESLLATLSTHLIEAMRLRREGSAHSKLAYQQGFADGVIRSLLDSGMASEKEVLDFVRELRRSFDGPGARAVVLEPSDDSLALVQSAH